MINSSFKEKLSWRLMFSLTDRFAPTNPKLTWARHQLFPDCDRCAITIKWSISNNLRHMSRGKRICKNIICHTAKIFIFVRAVTRLERQRTYFATTFHKNKTRKNMPAASGVSPVRGEGPGLSGRASWGQAEQYQQRNTECGPAGASRCDASWRGHRYWPRHSAGITIYKSINFGQLYK